MGLVGVWYMIFLRMNHDRETGMEYFIECAIWPSNPSKSSYGRFVIIKNLYMYYRLNSSHPFPAMVPPWIL